MPNLYDVLLERMEGRQYQTYFSTFCPFDTHKSPALLVYEDGFVCLSCHKTGTLSYLDKFTGSHFIPQRNDTVSRVLPRWRKWEQKYGDLEGIADAAHNSLKHNAPYQTYFKKRKIYEYVDEGNLGYLDGWCLFPVYNSGAGLVDIVVRSTNRFNPSRYVVAPNHNGERHLFVPSWEKVNEAKTIYVVYGIIDSISLHLAGLPSVTGVTGKSLNAELLKPLGKRFVIVPDENEEQEAHRLANNLGWKAVVKKIDYPEGTKDTDDIRRQFGNTALLNLLGA